ncbi:MAG: endonuclease/exonuclease/phosphatase family protein, partial [Acidimicrobiia bacterium]
RPDTAQLRVVSYNILGSNKHFDEVVNFIRASGADVVVLHEVTRRWEGVIEEASLTDGDWPYEVTRSRAAGDLFGTLVLAPTGSRVTSFGFGVTDPRAIEISLPEGIKMLAIHPLSPYTRFRASQNDQQLQFAANWARRQHGPTVVFGDFNSTPWSYPFRRLVAETGLRNSEHGFGLDLSYPADRNPFLRIPIDHLLHSADLATVDRHLGPALGSDHFPLTVDLAMVAQ